MQNWFTSCIDIFEELILLSYFSDEYPLSSYGSIAIDQDIDYDMKNNRDKTTSEG